MGYTTYQPVLRVHLQKCDVMIFCLALPWYTLWWCGFFSIFGLAWTNFTMGFHAFLYPVFLAMTVSFFTPWFSNDMKLEHDLFQEKEDLHQSSIFGFYNVFFWEEVYMKYMNFHSQSFISLVGPWWHRALGFLWLNSARGGWMKFMVKNAVSTPNGRGTTKNLGTSNLPGKLRRVYQQRKCHNKTPWQSNTESPA